MKNATMRAHQKDTLLATREGMEQASPNIKQRHRPKWRFAALALFALAMLSSSLVADVSLNTEPAAAVDLTNMSPPCPIKTGTCISFRPITYEVTHTWSKGQLWWKKCYQQRIVWDWEFESTYFKGKFISIRYIGPANTGKAYNLRVTCLDGNLISPNPCPKCVPIR